MDYTVGIALTGLISIVASFIGSLIFIRVLLRIHHYEPRSLLSAIIQYQPLAAIAKICGYLILFGFWSNVLALGLFGILFPVINILWQLDLATREWLLNELESGILSVRLVMLLLGLRIIYEVLTVNRYRFRPEMRASSSKRKAALCGYGYYVLTLVCVWSFRAGGLHSKTLVMLNWMAFFIVDDWIIIGHYYTRTEGKVPGSHWLRICVFSLAIALLTATIIFRYTAWQVGAIYILIVCSLSFVCLAYGGLLKKYIAKQ